MFCNSCGQPMQPDARFCGHCGTSTSVISPISSPTQPPHFPTRSPSRVSKTLKWVLIAIAAMIAFNWAKYGVGKLFLGKSNSGTSVQTHATAKPILDLNELALHSRADVEKAVGKPLSYVRTRNTRKNGNVEDLGDTATYSWGSVYYANNHLVAVQRTGPPRPYSAALAEFGLAQGSEPYIRDSDGTMLWNNRPFKSGIETPQGLVIDSAFLPSDFSELHIWILDGYHPKSWTDDECVMWLRMSGNKIPEAAMQRGDAIYWPLNHDNTAQACNSGGSTKY